jgi:transposase
MGAITCSLQLESEPPKPEKTNKVLGIDLGRTDIAVTSDGEKFSGKQITQVRDKYARVRTSLQKKASKGTRSNRRRCRQILQRLSGRGAIRWSERDLKWSFSLGSLLP